MRCRGAAGEMLVMAEPFLERSVHPTVIIRGYVKVTRGSRCTMLRMWG